MYRVCGYARREGRTDGRTDGRREGGREGERERERDLIMLQQFCYVSPSRFV